ncbi:MAG: Brp/Blh family beta-carotene 15,15'-dioxygenase [Hymenobacter sp.]
MGVLWWRWPAPAVGVFLLLTVWHWGSADTAGPADAPRGLWLAHSVLRGLLVFAVPAWCWPAETAEIVNNLLTFTGAAPLSAAAFAAGARGLAALTVGGHLGLWGWYARYRRGAGLPTEVLEVLLLTGLFVEAAAPAVGGRVLRVLAQLAARAAPYWVVGLRAGGGRPGPGAVAAVGVFCAGRPRCCW